MYVCSLAASYYTIILVGTILATTPPAKTCAQATYYETIELSLVAHQANVATNIRQLCSLSVRLLTPPHHKHNTRKTYSKSPLPALVLLLLHLSGDIEMNPGPTVFQESVVQKIETNNSSDHLSDASSERSTAYFCGSCKHPVSWEDQ